MRDERRLYSQVRSGQDKVADAITALAGSMAFIYLHLVWFGFWILANVGAFGDAVVFDRFPFGLLTMIVSLEAIFLSTFVMITQNRQATRDNLRAALDFETNVRSEVWSIHIGKALGLDAAEIERHVQEIVGTSERSLERGLRAPVDPTML